MYWLGKQLPSKPSEVIAGCQMFNVDPHRVVRSERIKRTQIEASNPPNVDPEKRSIYACTRWHERSTWPQQVCVSVPRNAKNSVRE